MVLSNIIIIHKNQKKTFWNKFLLENVPLVLTDHEPALRRGLLRNQWHPFNDFLRFTELIKHCLVIDNMFIFDWCRRSLTFITSVAGFNTGLSTGKRKMIDANDYISSVTCWLGNYHRIEFCHLSVLYSAIRNLFIFFKLQNLYSRIIATMCIRNILLSQLVLWAELNTVMILEIQEINWRLISVLYT